MVYTTYRIITGSLGLLLHPPIYLVGGLIPRWWSGSSLGWFISAGHRGALTAFYMSCVTLAKVIGSRMFLSCQVRLVFRAGVGRYRRPGTYICMFVDMNCLPGAVGR